MRFQVFGSASAADEAVKADVNRLGGLRLAHCHVFDFLIQRNVLGLLMSILCVVRSDHFPEVSHVSVAVVFAALV